jgi:hypothetical protein
MSEPIQIRNQPLTATDTERADRVVALFRTTMTAHIPPLSEVALHYLVLEAIEAARQQDRKVALAHTLTDVVE